MDSFVSREHPTRKRKAPILFDEQADSSGAAAASASKSISSILHPKLKKALKKPSRKATNATAKPLVRREPSKQLPDITIAAPVDKEAIRIAK